MPHLACRSWSAKINHVFSKVLYMLRQNIVLIAGLATIALPIVFTSAAVADSTTKSSLRLTSVPIVHSTVDLNNWCASEAASNQTRPFGISKVAQYHTKAMKKDQYNLIGCVTNNSGKVLRKAAGNYLVAHPDKSRPTGGHVDITSRPIQFRPFVLEAVKVGPNNFAIGGSQSVGFQPNEVSFFKVEEVMNGAESTDITFYTDDYVDP
jgi:hypothetical protein